MQQVAERTRNLPPRVLAPALAALVSGILGLPTAAQAKSEDVATLEQRVAELNRELEQARRELAAAKREASSAQERATEAEAKLEEECPPSPAGRCPPEAAKITIGPLKIGGAVRVNYVLGSYPDGAFSDSGPNRGGNGGNVELDTFRINLALDYENIIGKLEYRWYPAGSGQNYNFLHTGWLGYRFADGSHVEVGVNRVPFGPGPYGVSQSWFFDQHYYVGLADDMDLGVKYVTALDNWKLDLAYYAASEGSYFGRSEDSARYSYDAVKWRESIDEDGNVTFGGEKNGYSERNQFNVRAIYQFADAAIPTDLGVSLQYGQLRGQRADDGHHWAASVHMVNQVGNFRLASQITRYEMDIDDDNPWGTDTLIPMGAYDFAWPAATRAWLPAVSLSYKHETGQIPWLDYVLPYLEYSSIVKDEGDFNDSQMWTLGAAWARGGWYIYSDLVYSNGNYFVGNDGDDYSNIFDGVGDFGANGNDKWNYRFNINLGYYF
jgi:outer membrane murein-binding lipoprotein Lpp